MSKRRKSEDEEWSSEKQDVSEGRWWGGHVQLFPGQVLNSRKRTSENFFTSEGESTEKSGNMNREEERFDSSQKPSLPRSP